MKNLSDIRVLDLGLKPYKEIWLYQKELQKQRINNKISDTLILVEHLPVYTLGKNAENNHLLHSRDKSVEVFNVERGGDITFHGPGQLVCYPIFDLSHYKKSISWTWKIKVIEPCRQLRQGSICTKHNTRPCSYRYRVREKF